VVCSHHDTAIKYSIGNFLTLTLKYSIGHFLTLTLKGVRVVCFFGYIFFHQDQYFIKTLYQNKTNVIQKGLVIDTDQDRED
jgi:hypothetical protein